MKKKWFIHMMVLAVLAGAGYMALFGQNVLLSTTYAEEQAMDQSEEEIVDVVLSYISTERADDPLVEVEPGIMVKSSNVYGIMIDGTTYYYSLFPHMSYDPVLRGEADQDQVNIFYDKEGDFPVLIYTLSAVD